MKREDQSPENIDEHYKKHLIEPHKHDQTPRQTSILPPADPLPGKCEVIDAQDAVAVVCFTHFVAAVLVVA